MKNEGNAEVKPTDLGGDLQHQEDLQALHVNAAVQQLHGLVQVVLRGQRNHELQGQKTAPASRRRPSVEREPVEKASHLVVGVVKVHRLTERHFGFRLQVVQLDGSREL